ncbi:galectin-9-like [Ctenopharyngodon idella]|uniref:galectin-9-like n=1 Tax=Ctenopharyngodon idella TaxID=7959 RepID=UPI0022318C8E|nr:galectin-9-like [Ctenopharyngodon idella]
MEDSQQQLFCKPKTPFTGPLQGGLQEGKSIIVSGTVLPNANRVHVNLECGDDIALHFNPRYDDGPAYVVLNTLQKGNWGPERTGDSFLLQGEPFMLQILVTNQTYKISVNGKHFMDYKHRIPITGVKSMFVNEMVNLDFIAYQKPEVVPYKTLFKNGLQPGKDIVIYGLPNPDCKRIEMNFRHRFGIAFHYLSYFDANVVIRNTFENGAWGKEERSGGVPFKKDELFKVTISCDKDQFTVFVNDQQAHTYKHRFAKLEDIDVFEIYGDLQLIF